MKNSTVKNLVLCAFFIALGLVLPFITAQIQAVGQMLLPMHIPALLCGLICGPWYGLICGLVTPLLRNTLFGMPPLYPTAIAMSCELAVYGLVSGLIFSRTRNRNLGSIYEALIPAMIAGRVVSGLVNWALLGATYSWQMFVAANITSGISGIIVQLVLIPLIVGALCKTGAMAWPAAGKQTL